MKFSEKRALEVFLSDFDYEDDFKNIIDAIERNELDRFTLCNDVSALNRHFITTIIIEIKFMIEDVIEKFSDIAELVTVYQQKYN